MANQLGHNDATNVYCDLCDWNRPIASFEQAEAYLQAHLRDGHSRGLLYAVETDTGIVKPTPEADRE
jgi:hypothetical protein